MAGRGFWQDLGRRALLAVLDEQHAVTWTEAQARISDRPHPSVGRPVQPHILADSRAELIEEGRIVMQHTPTRGGSSVTVLHRADTSKRATKIERAAARKRALTATFNSWTTASSRYPQGAVGTAGERVVERSIERAAPYGLRYAASSGSGQVSFLLGDVVDGGALDGAVWADASDERGQITSSTLCPIEVKNIRHWIYATNWEVFRWLDKAARLYARTTVPICPVLITRRKAIFANDMSRALGFRILDVQRQFVLPISDVAEEDFEAVRTELGYLDLVRTDDAHPNLVEILQKSLIRTATPNAARWAEVGSKLGDYYSELRERDLDHETRRSVMYDLGEELLTLDPSVEARWAGHFGDEDDVEFEPNDVYDFDE